MFNKIMFNLLLTMFITCSSLGIYAIYAFICLSKGIQL